MASSDIPAPIAAAVGGGLYVVPALPPTATKGEDGEGGHGAEVVEVGMLDTIVAGERAEAGVRGGGPGGGAALRGIARTLLATEEVVAARFEEATTVAALVCPPISGRHVGTHNFVLTMLYRWGFENPERAPKSPVFAAAVWHPRPPTAPPPPHRRRDSGTASGLPLSPMTHGALPPLGGIVPATPVPGTAVHGDAASPGWKIRAADCEVIITAVAESQRHGVVYLASPHEWHLTPPATARPSHAAPGGGGGTTTASETEEQAAIQLILNAAAHRVVDALRGVPGTELVGGHGFVTDNQTTLTRAPSYMAPGFMTNDALTGGKSGRGDPSTTVLLAHTNHKHHGSHTSVIGMFGGATIQPAAPGSVSGGGSVTDKGTVSTEVGGEAEGGGGATPAPPMHGGGVGGDGDEVLVSAILPGGEGSVSEVDLGSPKLTGPQGAPLPSPALPPLSGAPASSAAADGGDGHDAATGSQAEGESVVGFSSGDGDETPAGVPSSRSDPTPTTARPPITLGQVAGTPSLPPASHLDIYTASVPRTLVVHPGEGTGRPFNAHRFIGPESLTLTVAKAYCDACSHDPLATSSYKPIVFKTLQVYEFHHPRHMTMVTHPDTLAKLTGLTNADTPDGSAPHTGQTAAAEMAAAARNGAQLRLAQALHRSEKAREVGLRFRHATLEDFKTISHDFYRFYKEMYDEELPEEQQGVKAAELKAAIEANEYFLLEAPPSWLSGATGVKDKLMEEETARERRVAKVLHTTTQHPAAPAPGVAGKGDSAHPSPAAMPSGLAPAGDSAEAGGGGGVMGVVTKPRSRSLEFMEENTRSQRMVAVGMASVRGRHPLGARIAEMFVREEYRRKGFALLVLNCLVDLICDKEDTPSLCLYADARDEGTAQLMAKAGFVAREQIAMVDVHEDGKGRVCAPAGRASCLIQ